MAAMTVLMGSGARIISLTQWGGGSDVMGVTYSRSTQTCSRRCPLVWSRVAVRSRGHSAHVPIDVSDEVKELHERWSCQDRRVFPSSPPWKPTWFPCRTYPNQRLYLNWGNILPWYGGQVRGTRCRKWQVKLHGRWAYSAGTRSRS